VRALPAYRLGLLALFLVDFLLLAFVPALGRCIHLSARLSRLDWRLSRRDWRCGRGAARDAIVGLRIKQVLNFGVLLVLGEDGEAWRGFERQAGGGIGLTGKGEG
jgi:hypothetical protein